MANSIDGVLQLPSFSITHRILIDPMPSSGTKYFSDEEEELIFVPKDMEYSLKDMGKTVRGDALGFCLFPTKTGNEILKQGRFYEVIGVKDVPFGDGLVYREVDLRFLPSEITCTRRILSLGARDPVTGWCAKTFTGTTIRMGIHPKGSSFMVGSFGHYAKYPFTGYTTDYIREGDELYNIPNNTYYQVETVEEEPVRNYYKHRICSLAKMSEHADRPATSGTWHVDAGSTPPQTDIRYRHKYWLDTYLAPATYIHEDDGTTDASVVVMFAKPDYGMRREFIDNGIDAIAYVDAVTSKPKETWDHHPYCFEEMVSIRVCAINKTGITATNLVEQFEQDIRRVATTYPIGSIRSIDSIKNDDEDLGGVMLYSRTVMIKYTRANDDYMPTYPTISWGDNWIYEGDRLSGGTGGVWTWVKNGSTVTDPPVITSDRNLDLNVTAYVADPWLTHGTAIDYLTDIYKRIRIRFKTTGNAQAKIIAILDVGTQTILAATSSATWTVVDVPFTPGRTVTYLRLYAATGVGHVYYDFVQIYKGTFILPNCTRMTPPLIMNEPAIQMPMRLGSVDQMLGMESVEIHVWCDLDVEPRLLTWKRPQAIVTLPKDDYNNFDIFLDLTQFQGTSPTAQLWHWVNLGWGKFKATLIRVDPELVGEGNKTEFIVREYRHGGAQGESNIERWGLNQ